MENYTAKEIANNPTLDIKFNFAVRNQPTPADGDSLRQMRKEWNAMTLEQQAHFIDDYMEAKDVNQRKEDIRSMRAKLARKERELDNMLSLEKIG